MVKVQDRAIGPAAPTKLAQVDDHARFGWSSTAPFSHSSSAVTCTAWSGSRGAFNESMTADDATEADMLFWGTVT